MNYFDSSRRILSKSIAAFLTARNRPRPWAIASTVAVALFAAAKAPATDGVWTTTVTPASWGTAGNWSGGVADGIDAIADFSTQDLTGARTVNLGGEFTVGTLLFGDTGAATAFNWTLAPGSPAGTLTLATSTPAGPTISVANQVAIVSAKLAGTQGFTLTGAGALRLSNTANALTGGIRLGSGSELQFNANTLGTNLVDFTANAQLTWQGTNTQDVSAQIKIEDGVNATLSTGANNVTLATALQTGVAGTGGIIKAGGGILTITAANTYTGQTKINVGRIVLAGGDNRLATIGTIVLGQNTNSGLLQLGDASGASNQTTTSLTTTGTGTTNAVVGGNASISTLTINNAAAVAYAGLLGGAGALDNNLALAKSGAGNLTISNAANTFTGGVTINQGALIFSSGALGSSGTITFAGTSSLQWVAGNTQDLSSRLKINDGVIATLSLNANTITFASPIQTGPLGTGGLTKGDSGALIIAAANTYTGATRVNNGRIILTGGDNRLSAAAPFQFGNNANSGVLQLGDASGASNQTVTNLTITGTGAANAVVGGAASDSWNWVRKDAAPVLASGGKFLAGSAKS